MALTPWCMAMGRVGWGSVVVALTLWYMATGRVERGSVRMALTLWRVPAGLCTDSVSADDFLPSMAYVVIQAAPKALASNMISIINFSTREDFEDMWIFHFVAAVDLVAQLPSSATRRLPEAGGRCLPPCAAALKKSTLHMLASQISCAASSPVIRGSYRDMLASPISVAASAPVIHGSYRDRVGRLLGAGTAAERHPRRR